MRYLFGSLVSILFLTQVSTVFAQDTIYMKGKSRKEAVKGQIKSETSLQIKLATGATLNSEDVDDIEYQVPEGTPIAIRLKYTGTMRTEAETLVPNAPKKKEKIQEVLGKYQEVFTAINDKYFKRHMEYKFAHLHTRLALEENFKADKAMDELQKFIDKHPTAWQFSRAAMALAKFQMEKGDFLGAERTYQKLGDGDVSAAVKEESQLQVAFLNVKNAKYADALKKLTALSSKLPSNHPTYIRAQVAIAECMVKTAKPEEAVALLRKMIKETPEKNYQVKAAAHNALGVCHMEKQEFSEARWEFLWVDVVYNQDPVEHAKALYNLVEVFKKLNEPEKSQQCRELLVNDKAFAGTEYQRKLATPK